MADESSSLAAGQASEAPHPGSPEMPRWDVGELVEAPTFTWRNWAAMMGPGLVMGGAAIGGGEWLLGPEVTAKYGGALLWLATLSILGQLVYNLEISRYTLYCGEPIFTGKFRTMPGPKFWLLAYLVLDFGTVFPYLAANAANPLATVILGHVPQPDEVDFEWWLMKGLAYLIFLAALLPLIFGGKIYNALKVIMSIKIVVVLGFLLIVGLAYSSASTWEQIFSGFFKFGSVPVRRGEDVNGNGRLDPGEDWDGDGHLDVVEEEYDVDGDGKIDDDEFLDLDGDGIRDGDNVENIFVCLIRGEPLPAIDFSMIASLAALAAIAGSGGLTNTTISNYTRDQGWGMGRDVGAIPSMVGGHDIKLSHVGKVFHLTSETVPRFRRWYRHVLRDQVVVWAPACFLGMALPSMLSVEFLPRGTVADQWNMASMTAGGVEARVAEVSGASLGQWFGLMTLLCGFLVLAPSMASTADGLIRRWVDVFWTASPRLRKWDSADIKKLYFTVLVCWAAFGLVMLSLEPKTLIHYSTMLYNIALGFSCWHTLVVNTVLLPRELRPGWFVRIALLLAGMFFMILGIITILNKLGYL